MAYFLTCKVKQFKMMENMKNILGITLGLAYGTAFCVVALAWFFCAGLYLACVNLLTSFLARNAAPVQNSPVSVPSPFPL
jgi:hypothetical protein